MSTPHTETVIEAGHVDDRPRPGRWRRTALALGALVVLVPAVLLVTGVHPWSSDDPDPVVAGTAGTADVGGATWGPVKAVVIDDTAGYDVPAGARLIAVKVPYAQHAGTTKALHCQSPRLTEQHTGRSWNQAMDEIGAPTIKDEPRDCAPDVSSADLIVAFVVPEDARGPYWVDVPLDPFADVPFPRFSVDP
ncbi:MAG: hypothetical protein JSS74_05675 [Actinobacteria bacterium]|nr:hypothetical protein [Actinomycetota bacterium]